MATLCHHSLLTGSRRDERDEESTSGGGIVGRRCLIHQDHALLVDEDKGELVHGPAYAAADAVAGEEAVMGWIWSGPGETEQLRVRDHSSSFGMTAIQGRLILIDNSHEELPGTAGNGSPASPFRTSPARKSAKGVMFSPTLAFSRAFT